MELTWDVLSEVGSALLSLVSQPFYYIGVLLAILQIRRKIYLERELFHLRLHPFGRHFWRMLLWGWASGLAACAPMLLLGSMLRPEALLWLWGTAIILGLFGIRYLCVAYAAGLLGLAHLAVVEFVDMSAVAGWEPAWLGGAVVSLAELHLPSLFALTAIIHLVEAAFMRWQGTRLASPLYMESKRGKLIGAYQLQGIWPAPVFLLVPAGEGGLPLAWTPWFGGSGAWGEGWLLLAFPVVFGFAGMTAVRLPEQKLRRAAGWLLLYSVVLLGAAIAAERIHWLLLPLAVLSIAVHELLNATSRWEESARPPRYVNDERGLCVLAVAPGGPADELGIQAGEIIHRVNGMRVGTKAQLHRALRQNSAFVKLEVLNLQGEKKFAQRALYEGDHHQLGLILAPDNSAQYYVERRQPKLLTYIAAKLPRTRRLEGMAVGADFPDDDRAGGLAVGVGAPDEAAVPNPAAVSAGDGAIGRPETEEHESGERYAEAVGNEARGAEEPLRDEDGAPSPSRGEGENEPVEAAGPEVAAAWESVVAEPAEPDRGDAAEEDDAAAGAANVTGEDASESPDERGDSAKLRPTAPDNNESG